MKKLFIIRTIIKDWFTAQLPYTAVVLLVFIISFTALFFVSTKVASEHLDSTAAEYRYYNEIRVDPQKLYDIWMNEDPFFKYNNAFLLTDEFYEKYFEIGLPPIASGCSILAHFCYTEKNGEKLPGTDFVEVPAYPVFAESEMYKAEPFKSDLWYDYEIIKGRDITPEELEQKKAVAVAPEGWAVDVGDVLNCFGREIEIVGICRPEKEWREMYGSYHGNRDAFLIPYSFLLERMSEPLKETSFNYNPGYEGKPENNEYVPVELPENQLYSSAPMSPCGGDIYPAFVRLGIDAWLFPEKISETQKNQLAELMEISPDFFTNEYDMFYYERVEKFNKQAVKECIITGIFCMINTFTVVIFLCRRNTKAYRIYRVYGCTGVWVFVINFISMLAVTALAFGVSLLIARPSMELFHLINDKYEFRPRCLEITSAIFLTVSVLACIPAAISAVRRSPVGK